ncbi:hypothetical protein SLEP1_g44242 [Rubroshorea leprosula]|uniref:Uncharacterized protein n=1 Tax=Rubroshorea leprosula TaxID=152421 RepID=A0AAV5LGN9_9ROSI|nr:hypothetical protein SLEP1_g44242 [Rubroshorea leprosula]
MAFLKIYGNGVCSTQGKSEGKRSSPFLIPKRLSRCSRTKQQLRRKRTMEKMERSMKKLKKEMEEIGEEQKQIREGQRQVREKFEAMEEECKQLREETRQITMQSKNTQLRLALMFQILKARENNDLVRATELTRFLRELIANQNRQIKST